MPLQPTRQRPYAQLLIAGDAVYQLTPQDVLWAARAAAFEGGRAADVLWTLTQRFATARAHYPTFGTFVQAFSQPINPEWRASGAFCRPGGDYAGTVHCSPERLARRQRAASTSWWALLRDHPEASAATLAWASGELENPVPRATNFADPTVAQRYLSRHPDAKLLAQRGNWFIVEPHARGWHRDHVALRAPDGAVMATRRLSDGSAARGALAAFWAGVVQPTV